MANATTRSTRGRKKKRGVLRAQSTAKLRRELARREQAASQLHDERARIADRIREIDTDIRALGGTRAGAPNGRKGGHSLADVLADVMRGKTMSVDEAVQAVLATGYRSKASNFKSIVAQRLSADSRFYRVTRGRYTVGRAPARRR